LLLLDYVDPSGEEDVGKTVSQEVSEIALMVLDSLLSQFQKEVGYR